jgi:hypothetical protein
MRNALLLKKCIRDEETWKPRIARTHENILR